MILARGWVGKQNLSHEGTRLMELLRTPRPAACSYIEHPVDIAVDGRFPNVDIGPPSGVWKRTPPGVQISDVLSKSHLGASGGVGATGPIRRGALSQMRTVEPAMRLSTAEPLASIELQFAPHTSLPRRYTSNGNLKTPLCG